MPKNKPIKIVLTGGHAATTAIAVIEELIRRESGRNYSLYWLGAKEAVEGKSIPTMESEIFPKLGVKFSSVASGRLQRKFTFWTIPSLLKIPFGFFGAMARLLKIRPKLILSFGGSASFGVALAGWFLGIPIVIHEQTIAAGRANRISSFFASKICLARDESRQYFSKERSLVTGNPILTQITEIEPKDKKGNPPSIFITGGSRGSQTINGNILPILEKLLKHFRLVHQTGPLDYDKFMAIRGHLSAAQQENYEVYPRVDPMQIDNLYREADIVISRGGANTVDEIMLTKRPAIIIPIPWTYLNEQNKNALYAKKFGIAEIIKQDTLSPELLYQTINKVNDDWDKIVKNVRNKVSPDKLAAKKVVDILEEFTG